MSIIWREREHTEMDNKVFDDQELLDGLKNYIFIKLFMISNMRAQTQLLEMLIHY